MGMFGRQSQGTPPAIACGGWGPEPPLSCDVTEGQACMALLVMSWGLGTSNMVWWESGHKDILCDISRGQHIPYDVTGGQPESLAFHEVSLGLGLLRSLGASHQAILGDIIRPSGILHLM